MKVRRRKRAKIFQLTGQSAHFPWFCRGDVDVSAPTTAVPTPALRHHLYIFIYLFPDTPTKYLCSCKIWQLIKRKCQRCHCGFARCYLPQTLCFRLTHHLRLLQQEGRGGGTVTLRRSSVQRRGGESVGEDCCVTHDAKQVYCQNGATQLCKHNTSHADGRTCFCVI